MVERLKTHFKLFTFVRKDSDRPLTILCGRVFEGRHLHSWVRTEDGLM